jgi:hypothetical protein
MRTWVVVMMAVGTLALAGCVTGAKGSARRQCYDAGFQPHTSEFDNCWKAIARADNAEMGSFLVGYATGYAAVAATRPHDNQPDPAPLNSQQQPRQCIYWTPAGKRVLQTVNGLCPMRYGE